MNRKSSICSSQTIPKISGNSNKGTNKQMKENHYEMDELMIADLWV